MNKINLKKYNLWSDTLNEETLCETIGTFDFSDEKPKKERGVESYNFENKSLTEQELKNKKQKVSKESLKKVLQPTDLKERIVPKVTYDESKSLSNILVT